ncbi:MAG: DUF6263 family protein [Pirellulaceae bacterium]
MKLKYMCQAVLALAICCFVMPLVAQDLEVREPRDGDGVLKWKFTAGKKYKIVIDQNVDMQMSAQGQKMNMTNIAINEMTLAVNEVNEDGSAKITTTIDRMKIDVDSPMMAMGFDSKDDDGGQSDPIASMLRPIIGMDIPYSMSTSGKVSDVQIDENAFPDQGGQPVPGMMNAAALEEMVTKSSMEFPSEKLDVGHSWTEEQEMDMGGAKVHTVTEYTYRGVADVDGKPLHVIDADVKMDFPDGVQGMPVEISDEDTLGRFFFDGNEGRLVKSTLEQFAVISMAGGAVEQELTQKTTSEFTEIE